MESEFWRRKGFKGYKLAANYTVAKGMMLSIEYYDLKDHDKSDLKQRTLWTELAGSFLILFEKLVKPILNNAVQVFAMCNQNSKVCRTAFAVLLLLYE